MLCEFMRLIYKAVRRDIIEIIKKLCKEMKVEIIEGEACRITFIYW